jgi:hypothetical protein
MQTEPETRTRQEYYDVIDDMQKVLDRYQPAG